ncbi:uncharacterized protein LOC106669614 isoform X2 [Cimex lectularius]|nr:uncharacterized protein LOC106669614 isoform X2 [Cimex lectularius]
MEILLGLGFLFTSSLVAKGDQFTDPVFSCARVESHVSMDLKNIEGMWFVLETIHHSPRNSTPAGVSWRETCPVLQFQVEERGDPLLPYSLKMWWQEGTFHDEYLFNIPQPSKDPGFWLTSGFQNVILPPNTVYTHFAGTVEVLGVDENHMVLTFCTPGTVLYSIVLSRTKRLHKDKIAGVNKMLERRRLPKVSVLKTCKGGALTIAPSAILIFMFLLFMNY